MLPVERAAVRTSRRPSHWQHRMEAPPPRRTRRRQRGAPRPLVITVVALVVALVLGTATVVGLRLLRKDSATGAGTAAVLPSDDWAHGAHKTWTLDTSNGADLWMGIAADGDQLIVSNFNPHSNRIEIRVTAYDVSGDEPREQWSTNLDREGYSGCVLGHFREAI